MGKHSIAKTARGFVDIPGAKAVVAATAAGTLFGVGSSMALAAPEPEAQPVAPEAATVATVDLGQDVDEAAVAAAVEEEQAKDASGWTFSVARAEVKPEAPKPSPAERSGGTFSYKSVPYNGDLGEQIVAIARQGIGVPYVFGGSTPSGWDCSGFVMWILAQTGRSVPHTADGIAYQYSQIPASEARPGDLVWWPDRHIAVYAGGNQLIGAQNYGTGTVQTSLYGNYVFVRVS